MPEPDEHVITRTGAIKHPESCRLSECPVLAERNRIEALEALLREALADPDINWKAAWADAVREALDA